MQRERFLEALLQAVDRRQVNSAQLSPNSLQPLLGRLVRRLLVGALELAAELVTAAFRQVLQHVLAFVSLAALDRHVITQDFLDAHVEYLRPLPPSMMHRIGSSTRRPRSTRLRMKSRQTTVFSVEVSTKPRTTFSPVIPSATTIWWSVASEGFYWRANRSRSIVRIVLPNPLLDKVAKLFGLPKQVLSLRLSSGVRTVIIDLVSLPPAHIKISHQGRDRRPQGDFQCLESCLVVPRSYDTVTGACDHYLRQLKGRIVRGGKTPIGGQRLHGGILQVTLNDVA